RRPGGLLRDAGSPLRRRPAPGRALARRLLVGVLHAARRTSRARLRGRAPDALDPRQARVRADELPPRRAEGDRALLARRQRPRRDRARRDPLGARMRAGLLTARPTGGTRLNLLQWFGLGGAPLAWAVLHVTGWGVSELHCSQGRLGVDARA